MASAAGIFNLLLLAPDQALYPQHNIESAAPGLPVKANIKIFQGVMVAYDPANQQAEYADPGMAATARVIGFAEQTVDNTGKAKGDTKIMPRAGIGRVKNDGNITAAHIYTAARVVDDHTVGVPTGTNTDRPAGLILGLDGDHVWILVMPTAAKRGPVTATLASTDGTAAAASASLANLAAETEKIGDDVRNLHAALVSAGIVAPAP